MQNQQIRLRDKRKRNRQTPKVKANKKKSNPQTPKVKANKKKRNPKTPKVKVSKRKRKSSQQSPKVKANKKKRNRQNSKAKANKKKSNLQRPRFRFDKKKSNLETPKVKTDKKKFWSNETDSKCQNNDKYCHLFQESSQLLNKVTNFLKNVITKLQNSRPIKEKVKNNPRFRVDKKKSYPRFRASNRNFNHQTPIFRFDKRERNRQIPRFYPGFRNHQTLRFRADTTESKCKNNEENCANWSKLGDCDHKVYGPYMKKNCKLSCDLCTGESNPIY